jgi:hypothetical protein
LADHPAFASFAAFADHPGAAHMFDADRESGPLTALRWVLIGLGTVLGLGLLVAAVGYLLVGVLRAGLSGGSPLGAAAGVGAMTLLLLGLAITGGMLLARRLSAQPAVQRTVLILFFGLVMALWPILMVWIVFLVLTGPVPAG